MKKVPYIEQMHHSECGIASLAMILNYYGHQIPLSELREKYGVPKGGTSLFQMTIIAKEYNFDAKGLKSNIDGIMEMKKPLILHWEGKHYVVLEEINRNIAVIIDPANGRQKISINVLKEKFSGIVLDLTPTRDFTKRKGISNTKFFLKYVIDKKKLISLIIIFSIFAQFINIFMPKFIQWMTDEVFIKQKSNYLINIGYSILILFASYIILSTIKGVLIAKLQTAVDNSLMTTFVSKLVKLKYSFFEDRTTGDLLFRANTNVYIRQILSTKSISIMIDILFLVTYIIMMASYNTLLAGVTVILGISIFSLLILSTVISKKLAEKEISEQAKAQSILSECLNGIGDVKVMGMEQNIYSTWQERYKEQLKFAERRSIWTMAINTIAQSLQFIMPVLILWLCGNALMQEDMSLGMVLAFNSLAVLFLTPIISLGNSYGELVYLGAYIQKLHDVTLATEEKTGKESENIKLTGEIELKNINFKHNYFAPPSLKNISLKISPGEKVAFVGASGSGKSTIIKILLGLYHPTEGDILYDGKSIQDYSISQLRSKLGVVFQEARLFNKSIKENITLSNPDISFEMIIEAAKKANIHDEIMKLPLKYETMISEFGVNFSGGQRQRIILARAFAQNPAIMILDEATSALDTVSEQKITNHLEKLKCTQIIVAHRLSTIKNADKIVVLDNGEIKEIGTHNALLSNKGYYYNLYHTEIKKEKLYEENAV